MNTTDLSRADMRAILKARGVKGASSMLRPECETLLAELGEPVHPDDARIIRKAHDDEPDLWPDNVSEVVDPPTSTSKRGRTFFYVCGHCASAPRGRDPDGSHTLCRSDICECSLLNHRPDDKVRAVQSKVCGAPVEACVERDAGRVLA